MSSSNISLEDVLDAVMLEEPTPSYTALLRWTERYPQYRDDLADFFATWAIQLELPGDDVELDEERIAQAAVRYALDIVRCQDREAAEHQAVPLRSFDELVLAAMFLLRGEVCSAEIVDKVSEMSRKPVAFGPVFSALTRLEASGLVVSRSVEASGRPKGIGKWFFKITRAGELAAALAKQTSTVIAAIFGELA